MKRILFIALTCFLPLIVSAQTAQEYYDMSVNYLKGTGGVKKDIKKSHKLRMKAAQTGHTQSQYDIGYRYYNGYGSIVKKDYKKAVEWFQKAAEKEHDGALYYLGWMYYNGYGLPRDKEKAFNLYLTAAEKGHENAIFRLRHLYDDMGQKEKEFEWLKRGAEFGHGYFMRLLGMHYEELKNYKEAEKWYKLCVENKEKFSESIYDSEIVPRLKQIQKKLKNMAVDLSDQKQEETKNITVARIGSDVDKDIPVAKQTQDKTFALIIANENYDGVVPVPYAKNDATTFEMYCRQTLGIPGDNIHTLKDATYGQMKRGVVWLQDIIKAYQGEAQVIVYYAGHGIPDEKSRAGYLLPTDGNPMNPASAYALEDLYKELVEQPSRSIVVLLDACFSGARREGTMLTSARGVAIKVKPEQPAGNLVVFSATQGDETAYAYDEQKHGLFTYYMLKKMKETNGSLTLGELSDFVRQQVMQQSVKYNGKLQTPTVTSPSSLGDIWKTLKLIP